MNPPVLQHETKSPQFSPAILIMLGVILNLFICSIVVGFMKTAIADLLIILRLLAGVLSIAAIANSGMILWQARKKLSQSVIGFVLLLFPVWTLFFMIAEWTYQQSGANIWPGEV